MSDGWMLNEEERLALSDGHRSRYEKAVSLKGRQWAHGPSGGWADGNILLASMGWAEVSRTEGHRVFTRLTKPDTIKETPIPRRDIEMVSRLPGVDSDGLQCQTKCQTKGMP